MPEYTVRSGQNIYDIATILYGGIEGIFDLLASNEWLTLDMDLSYGMKLTYHDSIVINRPIVDWLAINKPLIKNGNHKFELISVTDIIKEHFSKTSEIFQTIADLPIEEQSNFWAKYTMPRLIIKQSGINTNLTLQLHPDSFMIIDWGDFSQPVIINSDEYMELEHCYKGASEHIITIYGYFKCKTLDLTKINGAYYPLTEIEVDDLKSNPHTESIDNLLKTS